jgi:hypothetical protein
MSRIEARRKNASAVRLRFSQSLVSLRQRLSHASVRSTIQRLGSTTNPSATHLGNVYDEHFAVIRQRAKNRSIGTVANVRGVPVGSAITQDFLLLGSSVYLPADFFCFNDRTEVILTQPKAPCPLMTPLISQRSPTVQASNTRPLSLPVISAKPTYLHLVSN